MAKSEIFNRTINIFSIIWWRYIPGTVISVQWPVGWVTLYEDPFNGAVSTESADPNDHYRPWLEKNVGRQGWDWDWRIEDIAVSLNHDYKVSSKDKLLIKVRCGKEKYATLAALKWS